MNFFRRHWTVKKITLAVYDTVITVIAIFLAVQLMRERDYGSSLRLFREIWYIFPLTAPPIFFLCGFYDQMWAFAGAPEYAILGAGSALQTLLLAFGMQVVYRRFAFVVYVLYFFILALGLFAFRILYSILKNVHQRVASKRSKRQWGEDLKPGKEKSKIRVLIIGAGAAGSMIIRELKTRQTLRQAVGIVDDNPYTHNYKNQGIPVLGGRADIPRIVQEQAVDEIILAVPSALPEDVRDIVAYCRKTSAQLKTVPFLPQILSGRVSLSDLREVDIEDLLGREPVELDVSPIRELIENKTVLITGGGGSIGSEIGRQVAAMNPAKLILIDIYENHVYELQQELLSKYGDRLELNVLIASVRDKERLFSIFEEYKPQLVLHAAAHKHVPLMEFSRGEAIKNNIFGTANVAEAAGRCAAAKMILISTDKAVNPTNAMGASKRLAEITMLAMNQRYPKTVFSMVRFGNVLGSSGSVIPLFNRQIREERRVTVTDPEIRRYFMTIPEAVSLVLQAASLAKGGEIFILDMGEPVKIDDLARELIRLSGFEPDVDISVQYIGLRPGEKMSEELHLDKEKLDKTSHRKIFILQQIHDRQALDAETAQLLELIRFPNPQLPPFIQQMLDLICD